MDSDEDEIDDDEEMHRQGGGTFCVGFDWECRCRNTLALDQWRHFSNKGKQKGHSVRLCES